MNMKFLALMSMIFCLSTTAMERIQRESNDHFYSIVLPGQDGSGGESFAPASIITSHTSTIYRSLSGYFRTDLGQKKCIKHFQKQLNNDIHLQEHKPKLLLYGVDQGTATLVNWLTQKPIDEQEKMVGCLLLEAVLGHQIRLFDDAAKKLWWTGFPQITARAAYPRCNPYGLSLLASAGKLSPLIPIIIMHNKNDAKRSINDARLLYCILRKNNNKHVYLFEFDHFYSNHSLLVNDSDAQRIKKTAALQEIYKRCGLPYKKVETEEAIDLQEYQPSTEDLLKRIENH